MMTNVCIGAIKDGKTIYLIDEGMNEIGFTVNSDRATLYSGVIARHIVEGLKNDEQFNEITNIEIYPMAVMTVPELLMQIEESNEEM